MLLSGFLYCVVFLDIFHKFKVNKDLCISSIIYGELRFGIENGDSAMKAERLKQLDLFTQRLFIESWNEAAAKHYGYLRSLLTNQGNMIGNNDLLIVSHAVSLNATMVTNNLREFSRIPNLATENWLD